MTGEFMKLFLTSSPCDDCVPGGLDLPCILNRENGFVDHMAEDWKPDSRGLIISAFPDHFDLNDEMRETFQKAFAFHELTLSEMVMCDARNENRVNELIAHSDMIILAGGHVPTQNAFFKRIGLKELLENYQGIVMGISAGTMNCASLVYAQPEEPGESADPAYERFISGLGLTDVMILPHYQRVKDYYLDGKRLYEDITYADSMGRKFYALADGSYMLVQGGKNVVYGDAWLIQDGQISQVCRAGEKLEL